MDVDHCDFVVRLLSCLKTSFAFHFKIEELAFDSKVKNLFVKNYVLLLTASFQNDIILRKFS